MTDERGTVKPNGSIRDRRRRAYWQQTGVTPRWQLLSVYVLIVIAGATGIARTQQIANRADDLSRQNEATAVQAAALARDVADQRRRTIRGNCEDSNMRHDRTIATLDRLIRRLPAADRPRARQRRAGTVALIKALAPKRDCDRVVKAATTG